MVRVTGVPHGRGREGSKSVLPYRRTKMKKLPVKCQYSIALVARHGSTAIGTSFTVVRVSTDPPAPHTGPRMY